MFTSSSNFPLPDAAERRIVMKKWKRKKTELILDEKYLRVRKDRVELPNGKIIDWIYLDKADSPSAMVIGMAGDGKIIMNKQYRYLVGKEVRELPAGYGEKKENPSETARREFEEETGYKCKKLLKLGSVWESYGEFKHQIHIYFARGFQKTKQKEDPIEVIEVKLVNFNKAVEMVLENKIPGAPSALAILLLNEKIRSGEIKI